VKSGRLRHRITFQQLTVTQDENTGATNEAWAEFRAGVPADILPVSSSERLKADAADGSTRVRFVCRYDGAQGVTDTMRILHDGLYYNLLGPPIADRTLRRHYTIETEEGLRNG
jgi:SPP1 family predicted phage head-tail adaptor